MDFSNQLNEYISQLNCSSKDLSDASGLSQVVISRYHNGDRTPNKRSEQLNDLTDGLYKLFKDKSLTISRDEIYIALSNTLNDIHIDLEQLVKNFNELLLVLNINMSELARKTSFDPSYFSKLRSGAIFPSKPQNFINEICVFIINKYNKESDLKVISKLIDCPIEILSNKDNYFNALKKWLSTNTLSFNNSISNFLTNLDNFDLNEYIKSIHFDEMKIPFVPFYKSNSRTYYGIEEMKTAELNFFKATVLSKSSDPVFMCSDMPMEDMAKDVDFGEKWMYAIAMTLKKGLHLNVIHNLDRPFNEMMLGVESGIPIYMTGQVSPYYLKDYKDNYYNHLNYLSGVVALCGECINGFHNSGKYYLTSNKNEVSYYKEKCKLLLKKTSSLMDIYRIENKDKFELFLSSFSKTQKNFRRILSSLPLHTLSNELLLKILKHNNVSNEEIKEIEMSVENSKKIMSKILSLNIFVDEIVDISKDDFENNSPTLSLSSSFFEKKIHYNYEEYLEHLELTKLYAKNNKNYKICKNLNPVFKNIEILICEKKWVMISKANSPSIHFVIHHSKLRNAIENFIPPIIE